MVLTQGSGNDGLHHRKEEKGIAFQVSQRDVAALVPNLVGSIQIRDCYTLFFVACKYKRQKQNLEVFWVNSSTQECQSYQSRDLQWGKDERYGACRSPAMRSCKDLDLPIFSQS